MKQEIGIILIAIGHPYYGRMAYNLAMSVKAVERNAHITLVYTQGAIAHINHSNMFVFDNKFEIVDASQPFGAKLMLDQLSPYERTIYMDVDTIWVNKQGPSELFEKLKGIQFTGITEGMRDFGTGISDLSKIYPTWADLDEIIEMFPISNWADPARPIIYQWRSEFIYFEKGEIVDDFFKIARNAYARAHNLKTIKKFAGHIPDEIAINIAAAMHGIHPHQYKWQPTYWDRMYGSNMADIGDLQANYYALSCGSNHGTGALKRVYDRICSASAGRLGLQHVFPLVNKKEMMINRQQM